MRKYISGISNIGKGNIVIVHVKSLAIFQGLRAYEVCFELYFNDKKYEKKIIVVGPSLSFSYFRLLRNCLPKEFDET